MGAVLLGNSRWKQMNGMVATSWVFSADSEGHLFRFTGDDCDMWLFEKIKKRTVEFI